MCMCVGILNTMERQGGGKGGEILSVYACGHTECYGETGWGEGGGEIPNVYACGHTECYEETGWGWRDSECVCMWAY